MLKEELFSTFRKKNTYRHNCAIVREMARRASQKFPIKNTRKKKYYKRKTSIIKGKMFLVATFGRNRLEEIKLGYLIPFLTQKLPFNILQSW